MYLNFVKISHSIIFFIHNHSAYTRKLNAKKLAAFCLQDKRLAAQPPYIQRGNCLRAGSPQLGLWLLWHQGAFDAFFSKMPLPPSLLRFFLPLKLSIHYKWGKEKNRRFPFSAVKARGNRDRETNVIGRYLLNNKRIVWSFHLVTDDNAVNMSINMI